MPQQCVCMASLTAWHGKLTGKLDRCKQALKTLTAWRCYTIQMHARECKNWLCRQEAVTCTWGSFSCSECAAAARFSRNSSFVGRSPASTEKKSFSHAAPLSKRMQRYLIAAAAKDEASLQRLFFPSCSSMSTSDSTLGCTRGDTRSRSMVACYLIIITSVL